jgi:HPt (histidine-containing phosphotransfer) domain-containing protein
MAIDGMDADKGLRNQRGDSVAYFRLLRQFDSAHLDDAQKLSKLLADGEVDEAKRLIHTLKGTAGTLGLVQLQEDAQALETYLRYAEGKAIDYKEVNLLMNAIDAEQKNLHEALNHIAGMRASEQEVEADSVKAREIVTQLDVLLVADDTAVNTLFLEYESLLHQSYGEVIDQLGQQIEAFDYPLALKTLQSISIDSTEQRSQTSPDVTSPSSEFEDDPINLMALRKLFGDDTAKQLSILRKFISQAENIVIEIYTACDAGEAEQVSFLAHKLKSSARMVGVDDLADLCLNLEAAGKHGEWSIIKNICPELSNTVNLVKDHFIRLNGLP